MDNTFRPALGTSTSAALFTAAGIFALRRFAGCEQRNTRHFMYFATGFLRERDPENKSYVIGLILHEFSEGLVTYLFLMRGRLSQPHAMVLALLAAAASTPAGTLRSDPFVSRIGAPMLGPLLVVSTGALLYVGASRLLPHTEQEHKGRSVLAFGGGVLVAVLIVMSKG